ncbi:MULTISPECIES: ACP S-malonyltransferase [unclassified Streptomyces]|uniref:ACP S-malonyltransferase n=1 Tax=unclassified Streptomyces TaxID=2593676 RepID=UPI00278C6C45|nr:MULTISPECIES: ACP S-malonyltransferase [unclassified Streptomyces]
MATARLALMFPGQGAQRPGMGLPWTRSFGWTVVDEASEAAGRDVSALLLGADAETLRRTDNAQLATFTLALVALTELRKEHPLVALPGACAGHSLGEYTALVAAGILDPQDAVRLIVARGKAMRAAGERSPGAMTAVLGLSPVRVEALTDELRADGGQVWVANHNAPRQTVIAGVAADVERCAEAAKAAGAARLVPLTVGGAFHTPLMSEAAEEFQEALAAVRFMPGHTPVVADVDARPHRGGPHWADLLHRQITAPVRWTQVLITLTTELACDRLLEIGPGKTLTGLAKQTVPAVSRENFTDPHAELTAAA